MIRSLQLYAEECAAAIRASFSDRANFAIQVSGMFINNVVFLGLWWLFFAGFRTVGGWGLPDLALLMGLTMTVVGLCGVFLGGYRDMAAAILRGEMETLLTQPRGILGRMLARESMATAWGDVIGGILVLALGARLAPAQVAPVLLALAIGVAVYASSAVAFASMAFWIAGARSFARDLTDFTLLFSSYPPSIYQGAVKVLAFTVLPAGFVVVLPVRMVRHPGWDTAGLAALGAVAWIGIAAGLFAVGFSRYRRGVAPTP